jgi:hypothetical protein
MKVIVSAELEMRMTRLLDLMVQNSDDRLHWITDGTGSDLHDKLLEQCHELQRTTSQLLAVPSEVRILLPKLVELAHRPPPIAI